MPKPIKIIVLIMAGMCLLTGFVTNATASADILVESYHSYANNFDYTWPNISQPGATQMRLHFVELGLASGSPSDSLILLDKDGNKLAIYEDRFSGINYKDFWTDWYTGDTIKVRLITNDAGTAYGFKIDKMESRADLAPSNNLPESYHSYANNFDYTWPNISQPGATEMRLHFVKLGLASGSPSDSLILLDKDGNKLAIYEDRFSGINYKDFWTDWYTGDTIKVRLITNGAGTDYGFKIDKIETRPNAGTTPTIQPEFTPTEASGTSSITAQPTNVTTGGNNTTSAPLNTNTSEANNTAPSQNNSSYDLYGNTTPEKPTVSFYNNVTINNVPIKTDSSGANNTIPSQNNPSYGLCGNSICEGPTVSFYANVTSGTAPLKVLFISSTTGNPNSYFWVFEPTYSSDWNSKHAVTALHTFKNPGVYTVSLTVTNAAGSTTFTKYNYITVF